MVTHPWNDLGKRSLSLNDFPVWLLLFYHEFLHSPQVSYFHNLINTFNFVNKLNGQMGSGNAPLEIWNNGKPCLLAKKCFVIITLRL